MKFSPTEIDLCKQIAEKHVKEIHYGVWVAKEKRKTIEISLWNLPIGVTERVRKEGKWTPLWQIHDCLEWLGTRDWKVVELREDWIGEFWVLDLDRQDTKYEPLHLVGKTPLEALLKAVLAVLEQEGK